MKVIYKIKIIIFFIINHSEIKFFITFLKYEKRIKCKKRNKYIDKL